MTKEDFRTALEQGKVSLVRCGVGYNKEYKGQYNRYSIYANGIRITHHNSDWIAEHSYYVKRSEVLAMSVWGMSQEFEAKYCLVNVVYDHISCADNNHIHNKIAVLY